MIQYQGGLLEGNGKLDRNGWITPPEIEDPENIPKPLGWTLLVRPYPVIQSKDTHIILPESDVDYINFTTNVARVVAIGPCCWNKLSHADKDGKRFNWVEIGDFVGYPKHSGAKIKYKGVSFVILSDDEIIQKFEDPQIFDNDTYTLDIPEDHLKKYNTIYNKNYKNKKKD